MTERHTSIPMGNIITHPRLQNRNVHTPGVQTRLPLTEATTEHLDDLKQAINRGDPLPPIRVVAAEDSKPNRFYLVDGYHRFWAHGMLNKDRISALVLEGSGFADALVAAGRANRDHGLRLTKDQKVENAWRSLNLPETDYYRRLNKTEAEAELGVDRETIKKMRQRIRQDGIERGLIDKDLRGKAAEEALLTYWNDHPDKYTWRLARRGGDGEFKDTKWQERKAAKALAQVLADYEGAFGPDVAKAGLQAVGLFLHNVKPDVGMLKLRQKYAVEPVPLQDEDDDYKDATVDMGEFLEWQAQQCPYTYEPASAFNDEDSSHDLPSDFR